MANNNPAINGSQHQENVKVDKPPTAAKPMVYEPAPTKKPNGLSNGTTSHGTIQAQTTQFSNLFNLITNHSIVSQALDPTRVHLRPGAKPMSNSQKSNRLPYSKRRFLQRGGSSSRILITSMRPKFIAWTLKASSNSLSD